MKQTNNFIDGKYHIGGIPPAVLHLLLERLTKNWIQDHRMAEKPMSPRHPSFLLSFYKSLRVIKRVREISPNGSALSLLKTQFAKKPKNPV